MFDDHDGNCPSIAEVAEELGVDTETMIETISRLRDEGELVSVLWDEIAEDHDLARDDIPTIRAALGYGPLDT